MNNDFLLASVGSASHIGGRDEQQDRVVVQVMPGSVLMVVADGMGGHHDGAIAAAILVKSCCQAHEQLQGEVEDPEVFFNQVVKTCWQQIKTYSKNHQTSPHTTGVMAIIYPDHRAFWAHVGDARLYRLRNGQPPWRTADHSVVQMLLLEGEITEEEMATHPDQNRLWRSIGGDKHNDPTFGSADAELAPGEIVLLCSDGLWEQMQPHEMFTLATSMPPPEAAAEMVAIAAKRGGVKGDNVSVALWVTGKSKHKSKLNTDRITVQIDTNKL